MPQGVRRAPVSRLVNSGLRHEPPCPFRYPPCRQTAVRVALRAGRLEQRAGWRSPLPDVLVERRCGARRHRQYPLVAALAEHSDCSLPLVVIGQVQPGHLDAAQPAAEHQRDDGLLPGSPAVPVLRSGKRLQQGS